MLKQFTFSRAIRGFIIVAVGMSLAGLNEVEAQQSRGRVTHGGYYSGLGGRVVNQSHQNLGGRAGSGRQYTNRYQSNLWGPQYNQWTNWRTTPYYHRSPHYSVIWGQSNGYRSYGAGRNYGTAFQISRTEFYNPFGQTRWYW
jgi:hypothetical protein